MKNDLIKKNNVLENPEAILKYLKNNIIWDNSIASRKTASFGIPYNYSGINYPQIEMPDSFDELISMVKFITGFVPNNCLINFYYNNESKMGFHSDQIDILEKDSTIVIFSFGSPRVLRFKNKNNKDVIYDIVLENNSFFSMSKKVQIDWLHSVLPSDSNDISERYSITFRKIKV